MLKRVSRVASPVLVLVVALVIYRLAVGSARPTPMLVGQETPWVIAPQHNEPLIASDEELRKVLARVVPPAQPVNTNNYVHALRLWGPAAKFGDKAPSGQELRDYFLDDATYRRHAGDNAPPVFAFTSDGLLRPRSFDDSLFNRTTSSYHTDDLLATLAETGTPLDTKIQLRDGEATVRQLAESALRDFNLSRHEYEWTAIAYARYIFPQKRWKNKFGETISVDDLVNLLLEKPPGVGPCNGLHRLEALIVLYRADEQAKVLSPGTRRKMLEHMVLVSKLLFDAQTDAGYWTRNWPKGEAGRIDEKATVYDQLLVTGHQLEWLALAPEQVQPPRESIVRAARWTLKTILEISDKDLAEHYGPFSHAARALCLWRGKEPGTLWQSRNSEVGSRTNSQQRDS